MEKHQKVSIGVALAITMLSLLPVVVADTTSMQIRAWTLFVFAVVIGGILIVVAFWPRNTGGS